MTTQRDPPAGAGAATDPHARRIFHRVMPATLADIRQALMDIRDRFDGHTDADAMGRLELVLAEVLNNIALHGGSEGGGDRGGGGGGGNPQCAAGTGAAGTGAGADPDARAALAPLPDLGIAARAQQDGAVFGDAAPGDQIVIHLTVTQHGSGLACAVVDNGRPLPESCLSFSATPPEPEAAAQRAGGFGWFIIRDLTRSLFYFREEPRNVLCFNILNRDAQPDGRTAAGAA